MRLSKKAGAVTAALALTILAGCGSDRGEDTSAAADPTEGSTTEAAAMTFGDLESPCGDGDASGATDQGVTNDSITIGYGDDSGFAAAPGLSQEAGDAMDAMIAWCNEQGGINGREIVGNRYDAALTEAASVVQKSCKKDFMLVGQGFAYDEAAEQFRVGCDLPTVPAFTVGPNASMGPDKFEPLPFPADKYNAAALALEVEALPEFKEGPATVLSDSPAIQGATAKVVAGLKSLGVDVKDCGITISQNGEASYAPFAERLKQCGATSVWTSNGPIPSQFGLIEAIQRSGQDLQLVAEAQWYGETATQWNGASKAGDGLVSGLMVQPLENADTVPAVADYLEILEKTGGKTAMLGQQAASAFLLWATVAQECGSNLTRDCMVEGLSGVTEWTGGGLHAPTNPGENLPTDCALLMQLEGATWTQIAPETKGEFDCDPSHVIDLDPQMSGVTLNDDRLSVAFLKG